MGTMKRFSFCILFLMIALALWGNTIAEFSWTHYRVPYPAFFLGKDGEMLMEIGDYFFGGTTYELGNAKRAYDRALSINPKILWGHFQLARIYFVKGDFQKALEEINKEIEANPENLRSLYVRGLIYGYRGTYGDLQRAENDFRRFTLWAPSEWAGYNDLAWILSKEAKYQDAKDTARAGLSKAKGAERNPWLLNALGLAELNLGEYKAAKESFEKALPLAERLSLGDWQKSYPGNSPGSAESGLTAFQEAISSNLAQANSFLR